MHDIRSIRENPAAFDKGLRNRGMEPLSDRLIALDDARKSAVSSLQAATERRNAYSKEIGQAKAKKDEARAQELMAEVARIKETMPELEEGERIAEMIRRSGPIWDRMCGPADPGRFPRSQKGRRR